MQNDILNNFSREKVFFDKQVINDGNISLKQTTDIYYFALDTETTNVNNKECITYCTSFMHFATKNYKTGKYSFVDDEKRKMNIFTHPLKFWDFIENLKEQNIHIYIYNADYDINNILNYGIAKYNLKQLVPNIEKLEEYDNIYESESSFLKRDSEYMYSKISKDNKIYKLDLQLNSIDFKGKKVVKKISFFDMMKKLPYGLNSNVQGFTDLKMNKEDLDYSIFRDFGHTNYDDEELLYIWNDTYCLSTLTIEYCMKNKYKHTDKLTTSSMALENFKDFLQQSLVIALNDKKHKLNHIAQKYYNFCVNSRLKYLEFNHESNTKCKRLWSKLNNLIFTKGIEEGRKEFILENYFKPKDIFDIIFPKLSFDIFDMSRQSYCGGITRFKNKSDCGKWINKKGMGIDINSSFPYSYKNFALPYGNGKMITSDFEFKKNHTYIVNFSVNSLKIKKNKEPNLGKPMINSTSKTLEKLDTWVTEINQKIVITMTKPDFDYFIKNYEITNLNFIYMIEFKEQQGFFDLFTDFFYDIKQHTKDKGLKSWSKLILNGCYGKFGQNVLSDFKIDNYDFEENCITEEIQKNENGNIELLSSGVYLPVASFITSYSRLHLLKILNIINKTDGINWVYCDTDSAYVVGNEQILSKALEKYIDFDYTGNLGLWKIEKYFDKILIIGIKKYIYHGAEKKTDDFSYHVTLSGINKKFFKFFEEYLKEDENCICQITESDKKIAKQIEDKELSYYVNKSITNPFIYLDKELTKRLNGVYKSSRLRTVKNGQVLVNSIYCIKGGKNV